MGFRSLVAAIEAYLKQLLRESPEGWIEVRRKDVAERFDCVPSQVTYVINTRFNPGRGYLVESRRGGSGFIRIWRLGVAKEASGGRAGQEANPEANFEEWLYSLARRGILTEREANLLHYAFQMLEENLPDDRRDACKLQLLREILDQGDFF